MSTGIVGREVKYAHDFGETNGGLRGSARLSLWRRDGADKTPGSEGIRANRRTGLQGAAGSGLRFSGVVAWERRFREGIRLCRFGVEDACQCRHTLRYRIDNQAAYGRRGAAACAAG